MVLAKQTYRLTDTSDPNTIEDEINAAIEEQEKELQEAIDQAQEAVDKSDQITADLEETNSKIDNVKIEIDTNIGEINSKVDELQIIQPNLIGTKEPMIQLRCYPNNDQSSNDNGWAKFNNTCVGQEILPVTDITLAVQANKKYTQQIEISTDGTLKGLEFTFFAGGHNIKKANIVNASEENSYIAYASWTPNANNNLRCVDIRSVSIEGGTYVKFRHSKIEEGEYTPYTFKDGFNNLSNSMTIVEKTVNGLQTTVKNNEGKITEVTQTVQGIQTTVTDNTNKITQVTQTAEGLNSKVQENSNALNGTDYNLIKSYEITPTLTNAGNYFEKESNNIGGWATFTGSSFNNKTLNEVKFKDANGNVTRKENTQYTLSFEVNTNCDLFGDNCYIKVKINDQQTQLTSQNVVKQSEEDDVAKPGSKSMQYMFKYTFTPTTDFTIPNIAIQTARKLKQEYNAYSHISFRHFQIVEGTEVKDWGSKGGLVNKYTEITQTVEGIQTTVSNQDGRITTLKQTVDGMKSTVQNNSNQITSVSQSVDGVLVKVEDNKQKIGQLTITSQNLQSNITNLENNTNSKISQLSANINLRVEKDKVINQINISKEGILIDGSKVKITGQTYIENGVIKDAMIQSLKVDKITGNKASFVQAAFSDANSSTTINSRGILTKDRNNNTVGLNNGGLEMRDRSGNLVFKAVTRDWLDPNGYDDSAVLAALGRRQLTIGLAYNDGNEDNITPVISFKRREYDVGSSKKYYDSMYIEHQDRFRLVTTNYYRAQICDSRNAQNGNTYFSILSDSGKCGILWGDSQMYVKVEERCYSIKDILRRCNLL